jgi:hypothetical protein
MTDNWIAAAHTAGLDVTFAPHRGVHDWPDFDYDLSNIVKWDVFKPVADYPTSWVNDTVATRGKLWEFGYRFDTPRARSGAFAGQDDICRSATSGRASPSRLPADAECTSPRRPASSCRSLAQCAAAGWDGRLNLATGRMMPDNSAHEPPTLMANTAILDYLPD